VQQLALISSCPFHISQNKPVTFLCGEFSPLCGKKFKKKILSQIPPFFLKAQKKKKKIQNLAKFATIAYNMKWCLRFFYFNLLNIAKYWLNIGMDDCHLRNSIKLKRKTLNLTCGQIWLIPLVDDC
jgi:hypothetical protein